MGNLTEAKRSPMRSLMDHYTTDNEDKPIPSSGLRYTRAALLARSAASLLSLIAALRPIPNRRHRTRSRLKEDTALKGVLRKEREGRSADHSNAGGSLPGGSIGIEGNRWMVLVADRGATTRPETWENFLGACRSLITPTIYNALRRAKPPDGIRHYGFPASFWRHFEGLPRLPRGLLPVADALCRFNPVY